MSSIPVRIPAFRPATSADWGAIEAMLNDARLPLDGARQHLDSFIVGELDGAIVCAGALEHYGATALLRSVVVSATRRGGGTGGLLFNALKGIARSRGIDKLYLLTTTAAAFFARRGFTESARVEVPPALHASREFQGACPASATLMSMSLTTD